VKIVKFKNGKWGIKVCFGYRDITDTRYIWHQGEDVEHWCQGSKEDIQRVLRKRYRIRLL